MRLLVVLAVVAVSAVVNAEKCTDTPSCRTHGTTKCSHHTHAFCHPREHQCFCATRPVASGQSCTQMADCPTCTDATRGHEHCIDGHCVCAAA